MAKRTPKRSAFKVKVTKPEITDKYGRAIIIYQPGRVRIWHIKMFNGMILWTWFTDDMLYALKTNDVKRLFIYTKDMLDAPF